MATRAVEQVDDWNSAPFTDGYRGLHDLAAEEFSGVVEAGRAKLCMLGGTVVGILDGSIDDFEDAQGTAYAAPSPALPLLVLMQERSDDVRAKYYTEDTPISEVDSTLSDGGFSGYVELSENVLSGDYYLVFHAGRSMAVAWVGNSGQLLTGDEAFERADDEVGIYEVRPVDVDPIDIPDPDPDPDDAAPAGAAAPSSDSSPSDDSPSDDTTTAVPDEPTGGAGDSDESADTATGGPSEQRPETDGKAENPATTPDDEAATPDDETGDSRGPTAGVTERDTPSDPPSDADRPPSEADDADAAPSRSSPESGSDDVDGARTGPSREQADASDDESDPVTGSSSSTQIDGDDAGSGRRAESEGDAGVERDQQVEKETAETGSSAPNAGESEPSYSSAGESEPSYSNAGESEPGRESVGDTETGAGERDGGAAGSSTDATESTRRPPAGQSSPTGSGPSRPTDAAEGAGATDDRAGTANDETGTADDGTVAGPGQLETRSIPSLDPDRTGPDPEPEESSVVDAVAGEEAPIGSQSDSTAETGAVGHSQSTGRTVDRSAERSDRVDHTRERTDTAADPDRSDAHSADPDQTGARAEAQSAGPDSVDRVEELEAELARRESKLEDVESRLADAEAERDDLRAERDDLQAQLEETRAELETVRDERDDIRGTLEDREAELEELRSQLDRLESAHGVQTDAEQQLSPQEALDGTNLFVRYDSKGDATLEEAHEGSVGPDVVNENLGLEHHTQFDAAHTAVGGREFDVFLCETIQFRFVSWVVRELLYEIRDTGTVAALQDLYDAIPRIDRAELNGSISAEYTEDGQQRRSQESFDVVMRDRMGNPLIVANLNDSRQATTENMMSSLVTASTRVSEETDSLAAAFYVTSSFFEPPALETAAEATSGGLLSRDKRESFVKLTRKRGYHLCLVESREEKFHLAVPEL